jgi:glycosyltransferase involved in cell wall biosynthesis
MLMEDAAWIASRAMETVCWRLSAWDPDIASVRYRAAIPAGHLADVAVASRFSAATYGVLEPSPPDAVVFVKAFRERDVELAHRAYAAGVPVLLDVCDNVFAAGYRAHSPENLRRMAEVAAAVVTTGPALADILRAEIGAELPLHVVADPVETPEDVGAASRIVLRQRLGRAVRERRADIPRALAGAVVRGLVPAFRRTFPRTETTVLPQVLWFGNVGSVEPRFGIVNLADIAAELEAAAREVPFRLLVVTGDRSAYRTQIEPLALETAFAPWDRLTIFHYLRESDVVILPNSRDEFSICKSANRATLALSQGVPVVATRIPSLDPLAGSILFDDFRGGVVTYLRDRELASDHVRRASEVIERQFAARVVANRWRDVLCATARSA